MLPHSRTTAGPGAQADSWHVGRHSRREQAASSSVRDAIEQRVRTLLASLEVATV